jgi:SKICH domain
MNNRGFTKMRIRWLLPLLVLFATSALEQTTTVTSSIGVNECAGSNVGHIASIRAASTLNPTSSYTLSTTATAVSSGDPIIVDWTAPAGHSSKDWVALYEVGTGDTSWLTWNYLGADLSGSLTFTAPATPGQYEFRLFRNDEYDYVMTSNEFAVGAAPSPTPTPTASPSPGPSSYSVSTTVTNVNPDEAITVDWTAPNGHAANDWIGLYRVGTENTSYLSWQYVGSGLSGSENFTVPSSADEYHFRYFIDNSYTLAATSNSFTVGASPTPAPSPTPTPTPSPTPITSTETLFVATDGSDSNPGTISQPFLTIDKARQVVQRLNDNMDGDVTVYVRGGRYEINSTLAFDEDDSGTNGYNVDYRCYPGETCRVSGGVAVTGWLRHSGSIYKADVSTNRFRQFYVENGRGIRARDPNGADVFRLTAWVSPDGMEITPGNVSSSFARLDQVETVVQRHWANGYYRVDSVLDSAVYWQRPEGTDAFAFAYPQKEEKQTYHVENALEILDADGEWYINSDDNQVYYQLRAGESPRSITAYRPALERLLQIRGSALGTNAHHIRFFGFIFEHSNWIGPNSTGFNPLQANIYNAGDQPGDPSDWLVSQNGSRIPGAIHLENADHIVFERCVFQHLGAGGIEAYVAVTDSSFIGNVFTDIAAYAIVIDNNLEGSNSVDSRKVCARNTIKNNYIASCSQDYWSSPGIMIGYGADTTVEHNELSDLPYTGISLGWGWSDVDNVMQNNLIRYNLIYNVMNKLDDGGAIYTLSHDEGTFIQENYIHDVVRSANANNFPNRSGIDAIFMDEGSNFITVLNNVLINVNDNLRMNLAGSDNSTESCCLPSDAAIQANAGIEPAYQNIRP